MTDSPKGPNGLDRDAVLIESEDVSPAVRDKKAYLRSRIIGQDPAIDRLCDILEIDEAGLGPSEGPSSVTLLVGLPGVGKTALVHEFPNVYIGRARKDEDGQLMEPLTGIDCAFYQHALDVANLIGATKGYIGHESDTPFHQHRLDYYHRQLLLTEAIEIQLAQKAERYPKSKYIGITSPERARLIREYVTPFAPFKKVLFFDELREGHRTLWEIVSTILNGKPLRLADESLARFDRTAVFMAMNADEVMMKKIVQGGLGFKSEWSDIPPDKLADFLRSEILKEMANTFPSKFVSRVKEHIMVLNVPTPDDFRRIVDLRLSEVDQRFERVYCTDWPGSKLIFTDDCRAYVLERGIDRMYGARPLAQIIDNVLLPALSRAINWQKTVPGFTRIEKGDEVIVHRDIKSLGDSNPHGIVILKR